MHKLLPAPKNISFHFLRPFSTLAIKIVLWTALSLFIATNIISRQHLALSNQAVLGETTEIKSTNTLIQQYDYWKAVIHKHPDYRDAYYNLSLIACQLKKFEEARAYLDTVLSLDPNYQGGNNLRSLINESK